MPRFNVNQIENYGGNGGGGFFSLKNDGDVARVRILWNHIEDMDVYAVHEVEVDGRKRYVNCLREYDQPLDDCPFCKARQHQLVKLYVPIYDVDEDKVKYWERGKKFASKLSSLFAHYGETTPLVEQVFEIERHGKQGDTSTTYEIYPYGQPDGTALEDLPEALPVLGSIVLDKTSDELETYLETGAFPSADNAESFKRRETRRNDSRQELSRRTPTRTRTDRF